MSLPTRMMEIFYDGAGGAGVVRVGDAEVPRPGDGQVLIEVAAAGVNRPDLIQRSGKYPPPKGESGIPGLEVSGRIAAVGSGVAELKEGDEVCALLGSGGYAEYAVAAARLCLPKPEALSLVEAGGVPETFFTVFDNVFTRGHLAHGERVLIHGGSSGIGSTAIQLAKAFGAEVFTTAGTAEKCAFCRTLGADHAIDYHAEDFVAVVKEATGKTGVNLILDMVGGDYMARNIACLAMEGRLVQIAFLGSPISKEVDFTAMMVKRLVLTGSTLRARTVEQKGEVAQALRRRVWPLLDEGRVKPIVHATFPLAEARRAQEMMEASTHLGKILLVTGR